MAINLIVQHIRDMLTKVCVYVCACMCVCMSGLEITVGHWSFSNQLYNFGQGLIARTNVICEKHACGRKRKLASFCIIKILNAYQMLTFAHSKYKVPSMPIICLHMCRFCMTRCCH